MNELLIVDNGQVVVNSRQIASNFNKDHHNVLRDIENVLGGIPKSEHTPMFLKSTYIHEQNKQEYPQYIMNRDGFTILAMGFNGADAMQWKLKYIKAFNEMERQLKEVAPKPMSELEILVQSAQALLEHDKAIKQLANTQIEHSEQLAKLMEIQSHKAEMVKELPIVNSMDQRSQLNQIIRGYSDRNTTPYGIVWSNFYNEFYHRYSINLKVRAKNRKQSVIDFAEYNGYLPDMLSLAVNMFC